LVVVIEEFETAKIQTIFLKSGLEYFEDILRILCLLFDGGNVGWNFLKYVNYSE